MLGLLLARAGVQVTVLEKHGDFLRDFRGDTVHASTLTVLDELGLAEEFTALPTVRYLESLTAQLDAGEVTVSDLRWLPGRHKHIALVPQWDFLGLLAEAGRREPAYDLVMNAEVTELVREHERVVGVRYRHNGLHHDMIADLVVACDGRHSTSDIRWPDATTVQEPDGRQVVPPSLTRTRPGQRAWPAHPRCRAGADRQR